MSPPFSYGVLRSFTGSVSCAPLTDTQSSLGHYFFWGGGGGLSVGFTLLVFVLGLSAVTGSCVTEITHCGKRVTIFATYQGSFPVSRNFYARTCVEFMFANKIEAFHERSLVSVKVEPRSTSRLSSALFFLASILFT